MDRGDDFLVFKKVDKPVWIIPSIDFLVGSASLNFDVVDVLEGK